MVKIISGKEARNYVSSLLLNMKPESEREEYAQKLAIAQMLRARSEYDPSIQEYMKEHSYTKETLEQWIKYWREKLKRR
jgi:polyhydroxyalkanoate synthesis regulator phasin